jgi:hypothetical protein
VRAGYDGIWPRHRTLFPLGGRGPQRSLLSSDVVSLHVTRHRVYLRAMAFSFKLSASPKGPDEIDALTGPRREQFLAAAKGEMEGKACKKPSDYFRYMAKELEEEEDEQTAELWTVTKEGKDKAIFDLWYFPSADNGKVFEAGTTKSAGVEIIQGEFEAPAGGKKAEKLAEELQDPFDDRDTEEDEDDDDDDDDDDDEDEDEDDDDDDDDDDDEDEDEDDKD